MQVVALDEGGVPFSKADGVEEALRRDVAVGRQYNICVIQVKQLLDGLHVLSIVSPIHETWNSEHVLPQGIVQSFSHLRIIVGGQPKPPFYWFRAVVDYIAINTRLSVFGHRLLTHDASQILYNLFGQTSRPVS